MLILLFSSASEIPHLLTLFRYFSQDLFLSFRLYLCFWSLFWVFLDRLLFHKLEGTAFIGEGFWYLFTIFLLHGAWLILLLVDQIQAPFISHAISFTSQTLK